MDLANPYEKLAINYGSFMTVKVRRAKSDFNDKSVTLSTSIITILNADFNGEASSLIWSRSFHFNRRSPECSNTF